MTTKIYRFEHGGQVRYGIDVGPGQVAALAGTPFDSLEPTSLVFDLDAVRLLAPCCPTKIVAVALNYRDHAAERHKPIPSEPVLFLKPPSAIIGPGDDIQYPKASHRVDYEGELGVVIGRRARQLGNSTNVEDFILGFTCVNDVSARDLQEKDVQYGRAKGFDTFAPVGPAIVRGLDPSALNIETRLNGKVRQSSNTRNLIFTVPDLVRFVSGVMTLEPGDLISTGTPGGIGPMTPGDRVEVEIEGIGTLANTVMKVWEGQG